MDRGTILRFRYQSLACLLLVPSLTTFFALEAAALNRLIRVGVRRTVQPWTSTPRSLPTCALLICRPTFAAVACNIYPSLRNEVNRTDFSEKTRLSAMTPSPATQWLGTSPLQLMRHPGRPRTA